MELSRHSGVAALAILVVAVGATVLLMTRSPAEPMLVGTSLHREAGESHTDAFNRRAGNWDAEPEIVRFFYPDLPRGEWPSFGAAETLVSFKVSDVSLVPSGEYDAALVRYLTGIPDDGTAKRIVFYHEPEDDIASEAFTAPEFRAATEHIAALVDQHAPQVEIGLNLMGWTADPASGRDVTTYVSAEPLDFIGWDIYPDPDQEQTTELFAYAADASKELGVDQWLIAETAPVASSSQQQRAAWIPMAFDVARDQGFVAVMYFDSTVGGDFRLKTQDTWDAIGAEIKR